VAKIKGESGGNSPTNSPKGRIAVRPDREILEEILKLSRMAATGTSSSFRGSDLNSPTVIEYIQNFNSLVNECNSLGVIDSLKEPLLKMWKQLHDLFMSAGDFAIRHNDMHDTLHNAMDIIQGTPEKKRRRTRRLPEKKSGKIEENIEVSHPSASED
jgi:hypothetical protein